MPGLFQKYRIALLDASFFVSEFSDKVRRGLEQINVYVADTFLAEVEQYKAVLPASKRAAYDENIRFLNENKQLITLDLDSFDNKSRHIHNDTWGVLTLLVSMKAKFVLITADKLLIQRVVLNELDVDIYDLDKNTFIQKKDFPAYTDIFELKDDESYPPLNIGVHHVEEESLLYRANNSPIILGKEINLGAEATLFHVRGNPNLIVKIFKEDCLNASKYTSILRVRNLNQLLDIPWALFPLEVVYYDANCSIPAGFTESYVSAGTNLDDNPLYLGNISLSAEYLNTRLSDTLELCIQVVRQVHYLNSHGILVSDFNLANFALPPSVSSYVQMWDTDSFGYESFFSGYCDGNRTSREYDISTKNGVIGFSCEALHVFTFSLLSLGDAPISEFSGKFKFDKPDYEALYRKDLFPDNLWNLFTEVFRGEKEPSLEVLLQQLHIALQLCKDHPKADRTYQQLLSGVVDKPDTPEVPVDGADPSDPPEIDGEGIPAWLVIILIAIAVVFILIIMTN